MKYTKDNTFKGNKNNIGRCKKMENEIVKTIASQGAWALLFVWLLFYVLKENSKRENNYQETINKLADKISIIEDIKEDVKEIKTKVDKERK